jgi:hypothetical protein
MKYDRTPIIVAHSELYDDELPLVDYADVTKDTYNAMLHEILDNTVDGDHRSIAQNYIIQLSLHKANLLELDEFIAEAVSDLPLIAL